VAYNTVSTPRGGQYQVVLADGSKVYLNAASSIRFPAAFTGNERRVEITGEAFFEVTKRSLPSKGKMPFIVTIVQPSGSVAEVEVLGTTFNINSYANEPEIRTTLVEGSVKVSSMVNGQSSMLQPGQQASILGLSKSQPSHPIPIQTVDVSQETAWVKGLFFFNRSDIKTVFRQLERWYDIEVVYEGAVPDDTFSGKIQRNLPLSRVLKYLEKGNIHYQLYGKKLVIQQ
jgi:ferric-dicitrate binding protein FerR (iron transport regulator)